MRDAGLIADCLLDNDPENSRSNNRRRSRSLLISTAIEIALVAALLLWPILNPGILGARYTFVPVPPYHAGGGQSLSHAQPSAGADAHRHATPLIPSPFTQPPSIPATIAHIDDGAGAQAPSIGNGSGNGNGLEDGLDITGATGQGLASLAPPVKPPNPAPAMVRKSEGVQQGLLERRIEPTYPQMAILMRLTGTVKLEAIIDKDGSVGHVEVLSGHPILARAAIDAVRQWHYKPTLLNGQAVAVDTFIAVNFILNR